MIKLIKHIKKTVPWYIYLTFIQKSYEYLYFE